MKTTTHIRAPSRVPQSRDGLTVRSVLKSGLLAFALVFGLRVSGQTTTTATNFSVNMAVPDALPSGLASSKIVATPITYISGLKVSVKLNGTWNGDIYCYLTHSSGYTVLLNRVGRRTGSSLGYGDEGFDVTFDDGAANGDIHIYRRTVNTNHSETTPVSGALTNVWAPDGRTDNPTGVLDTSPRAALLGSFNGLDPNGEWVLFVADMEAGDIFTLDNWGLEITGYTPPSIVANPVSGTNECSTGATTFSVTATGSTNLVYQWRHNGTSVSGATDSALALNNPTFNDAGDYDVVITNNYGAYTSLVATLTVQDTTPPSITCPPVVVVNTDPDVCFASGVSLGTPVASDTCGGVALSNNAPSQIPLGTNTVVWTATDEHGNVSNCTQTVVVRDMQPPVITSPPALTDVPTDSGKCYATSVGLGTPQSHDNCGILTVTNDAPAQFQKGETTVTWTAVDNSGNIATATQVVTVKDHELPTITAPSALADVHTSDGQCYATNVNLGTPVTADNCEVLTVTNNAPAQFAKGDTTVIWTVVDTSGNMATASQLVTVQDHELPTITAPAVVSVNADAGKCYASTVSLGTPVTADNCGGTLTVTNNAPSQFAVGTTNVTWTVIDTSGNLATATQSVTVNDSQLPVVTCPADVTVYTTNLTGTTVTFSPTAEDNCGIQSLVANPASGSTFSIGPTVVTVTATDIHGNTNQCTFTVTVVLDHAPVAGNINLGAVANHPRTILIDKILGEASDPDSDTMSVVAVSASSTNGGTVVLTETNIVYTPVTNYTGDDLFTYTISDAHSGNATGAILVRVLSAAEAALNQIGAPTATTNGTVVVSFAGIAGFTHTVERSTDQSTWTAIGTYTVPANGIVQFTDSAPIGPPYYYRTAQQ